MKILLAIDGSPCSDAAVAEVSRRPWPPESEVRLISVDSRLEEFVRGRSTGLLDDINRQLRATAQNRLNEAAALFAREAPELRVSAVLREGWPKDVILDEAEDWQADLIVLGSHGYGAIKRLFLGSVSLAVATNASCSVTYSPFSQTWLRNLGPPGGVESRIARISPAVEPSPAEPILLKRE